jgi:methionyl-tRNA formyltransferase
MRIVFFGAVEFSRRALEELIAIGANVVGVCTLQESRFNADHCDLSAVCEAVQIPWRYVPDVNSSQSYEWIADRKPDVIFCFGWSALLRRPILDLAPLGIVGFHPTVLPANSGRHPIVWALALRLEQTGATFFFMDDGTDTGDILSQRRNAIAATDNARAVREGYAERIESDPRARTRA